VKGGGQMVNGKWWRLKGEGQSEPRVSNLAVA
jgi:hypothetical protein